MKPSEAIIYILNIVLDCDSITLRELQNQLLLCNISIQESEILHLINVIETMKAINYNSTKKTINRLVTKNDFWDNRQKYINNMKKSSQPNSTFTVKTYFEGLKIIVERQDLSIDPIIETLGIDIKYANEILTGSEEMGIVSKATKKKPSQVKVSLADFQENITFYQEGIKARMYDFNSVEGIRNIPIPRYEKTFCMKSPVNNIEYILQRRAVRHKKNGRMDLAIECLKKSNELMPYSDILYTVEDYQKLASYLEDEGRYEEALKELLKLDRPTLSYTDKNRLYAHLAYTFSQLNNPNQSKLCSAISLLYQYKNRAIQLSNAENDSNEMQLSALKDLLSQIETELDKFLEDLLIPPEHIRILKSSFILDKITEQEIKEHLQSYISKLSK